MRTTLVADLLAVCLCLSSAAPLEDNTAPVPRSDENYRLPTTILPSNYNITLKPYLLEQDGAKRFTFDGEVFITVQAKEKTNQIIMHSKNLKFATREFWKVGQTTKTALPQVEPNSLTDIVTYNLTADMDINQDYILHFVYSGTMDDDMHGFYRSSYNDTKNVTK